MRLSLYTYFTKIVNGKLTTYHRVGNKSKIKIGFNPSPNTLQNNPPSTTSISL